LGYLLNSFTAKEIASKIEAYEDRKEQEKELEFEFVYRVFNYKENKYEFYPDIKTAISRCKELLRLNPDVYAKYEKVLRVKRSDEE
jgi:hypothetical protein